MSVAIPPSSLRAISRVRLGAVLGINQTLSWGMTFYLPAVIAVPAGNSLGQAPFRILGAFSWSLLVAGCCAPLVGRWIDRRGGRGALLTSILVIAAGQALLALAPNLACWYLGWTVIGVGMAMGLYDAAFATIGGLLGSEAGPSITGVTLFAGFASTVFWTLGSGLIAGFGWRGLMAAYAGLMLLVNLPMVWLLVPATTPRQPQSGPDPIVHQDHGDQDQGRSPSQPVTRWPALAAPHFPSARQTVSLLAAFFALRWFITSAIAVHVMPLLQGVGLTAPEAVGIAALIGPGQVAGRIMEWTIGGRINVLAKARLGALLFPLGVIILALNAVLGATTAAVGFALLYGMSNGIMTINRGTLPLALFGPAGYARLLGWLAVPVLLAQATAPTLATPVVDALPALDVFLICGAAAAVAVLFLLPLRLPEQPR